MNIQITEFIVFSLLLYFCHSPFLTLAFTKVTNQEHICWQVNIQVNHELRKHSAGISFQEHCVPSDAGKDFISRCEKTQDSQCAYNVIVKRVLEGMSVGSWVHMCFYVGGKGLGGKVGVGARVRREFDLVSFIYPVCHAQAPYFLRPLCLHRTFLHYFINGTTFGKSLLNIKMCVLISCTNFT